LKVFSKEKSFRHSAGSTTGVPKERLKVKALDTLYGVPSANFAGRSTSISCTTGITSKVTVALAASQFFVAATSTRSVCLPPSIRSPMALL
jgi:hypothetical protein